MLQQITGSNLKKLIVAVFIVIIILITLKYALADVEIAINPGSYSCTTTYCAEISIMTYGINSSSANYSLYTGTQEFFENMRQGIAVIIPPAVAVPIIGGGGYNPLMNTSLLLFYNDTYYAISTYYPLNDALFKWKKQYNISGNVTVKLYKDGVEKWYMISDDTILELFFGAKEKPAVTVDNRYLILLALLFLVCIYSVYLIVAGRRKKEKKAKKKRKLRDREIKDAVEERLG